MFSVPRKNSGNQKYHKKEHSKVTEPAQQRNKDFEGTFTTKLQAIFMYIIVYFFIFLHVTM